MQNWVLKFLKPIIGWCHAQTYSNHLKGQAKETKSALYRASKYCYPPSFTILSENTNFVEENELLLIVKFRSASLISDQGGHLR